MVLVRVRDSGRTSTFDSARLLDVVVLKCLLRNMTCRWLILENSGGLFVVGLIVRVEIAVLAKGVGLAQC